ncbi:sigma-54-dependent Fis family transcriptional regulator [Kaistia dalseonensis]|uniref:Transcriptional regulator of acetoin/glycerol metabolism n=1 Tax=Kaistia dalseonensis TaxID=410840 RepID=A0ABU0H0S1_9HYPH|nr:sigma-54-dependent Fis family transcriptional regulator [Kaistia dalseonensis]MCX5493351.1 sigma-54-dependent Fis family transcriptional regulator [Kaistia dalseonensis]MDQ0435909.1 transcriptional regulator of acetoin/glycerol metabolism [Kaistia dalseonensis]
MSAVGRRSEEGVPNKERQASVIASWQRCVEKYGLEPYKVAYPTIVTRNELNNYRAPIEDLIALAMPEVERLFERFVEHDYIVSMTDENGVTVLFRSQDPFAVKCTTSGLQLGAIWSEELQGTNGIGTCIKEARPISIVMDNHFDPRLIDFSCAVAPIFGGGGKLAAALNVSTSANSDHATQSIVREVVRRSARRIENRFFARRYAGREMLRVSRYEDFCDAGVEMSIALDSSGKVLDATPDALRLMSRPNMPVLGRPLSDVGELERDDIFADGVVSLTVHGNRLFLKRTGPAPAKFSAAQKARALPRARPQAPDTRLLVGDDPTMSALVGRVQKLVNRRLPILLQGETGAGKTALAKALHAASDHADGPFVSINCAAIPAELIESELFGYRPGAFTGASKSGSKGRIAEAHGGTLFLDEIGDMPLALQTRLLQVLSDGEFVAIGATEQTRVEFALISASLHDIPALVALGRFRQDLYFRLNGASLAMPPLRERADRHAVIERVFKEEATETRLTEVQLDPAARKLLFAYSWPGNMRELRHVARFATTLAEGAVITVDDLPTPLSPASRGAAQTTDGERQAVELALQQTGWNVKLAAQRLGVSRATLHRRISAFGLARVVGDTH